MTTLAEKHDCLLLDLDGTVFRGAEPTTGAVETLAALTIRTYFTTNNASRSTADVAAHLRELGFDVKPHDVVTSAQTAARLLRSELPPDSPVLVVGTDALAEEVSAVGLRAVRQWADKPVAVVQGHSPRTGWPDLAEAALAIRAGALWIAANVDTTLPSERGLLPGNGSMVAALRAATDREPRVAGKPQPALMRDAVARGDLHTPLVVGDRLNTDIAGANAADMPSLLVLTGVSTARDAVTAAAAERPTYIGHDLRALGESPENLRVAPRSGWHVDVGADTVTVTAGVREADDDGLALVRAVADAVWGANTDGESLTFTAGDDVARAALQRWSMLDAELD